MADSKDSAPASAPEADVKIEETKSDVKAGEPAPAPAPAKKLWSDEDFGEVDFSGLRVAETVGDIVDEPEHIKSETIVEPETIKKVRALAVLEFEFRPMSPAHLHWQEGICSTSWFS